MIDKRNRIPVGENYSRIQNSTDETTVSSTWSILYRVVASNAHASTVGTVTLKNDSAVLNVLRVPAASSVSLDIGAICDDGIKVQNSITDLDTLILHDGTT